MRLKDLMLSGCSSVWSERGVWDAEVAGSNPVTQTLEVIMKVNPDSLYKGQRLYVNGKLAEVSAVMQTLGGTNAEFWLLEEGEYYSYDEDEDVLTTTPAR
jgi:hypothetical protein